MVSRTETGGHVVETDHCPFRKDEPCTAGGLCQNCAIYKDFERVNQAIIARAKEIIGFKN